MTTIYKAMAADDTTRHDDSVMRWGDCVTNRATGPGTNLYTDGVIHGYRTPLQAAFMLPIHAPGYTVLRRAETPEIVGDDGTSIGGKEMTTYERVPLPAITIEQRVEVAIRVSLLVCHAEGYVHWAEQWLSGEDRTAKAAEAAGVEAYNATMAAAYNAVMAASAGAAWAAMEAVRAATVAARAAAWAAMEAARAVPIDLCTILEGLEYGSASRWDNRPGTNRQKNHLQIIKTGVTLTADAPECGEKPKGGPNEGDPTRNFYPARSPHHRIVRRSERDRFPDRSLGG